MRRRQVVEEINKSTMFDSDGRMIFILNGVKIICSDWEVYNGLLYIYSLGDCLSGQPDALMPINEITEIR